MPSEKAANAFKGMVRERYWLEGDLLDPEYRRIIPPKGYRQRIANAVVEGVEHIDEEEFGQLWQIMYAFKGCGAGRAKRTYEQIRKSLILIKMSPSHHDLYMHLLANPHHDIDEVAKALKTQTTTAKYQAFDLLRVRALIFKNGKLKTVSGLNVINEPKRGRTCEIHPITIND